MENLRKQLQDKIDQKITLGYFSGMAFPSISKIILKDLSVESYGQHSETLKIVFKLPRKRSIYQHRVIPGEMLIVWDGWDDQLTIGNSFSSLDKHLFRKLCKKVEPAIRLNLEEVEDISKNLLLVGSLVVSRHHYTNYRVVEFLPEGVEENDDFKWNEGDRYKLISEDGTRYETMSVGLMEKWEKYPEDIYSPEQMEELYEKYTNHITDLNTARQKKAKESDATIVRGAEIAKNLVPNWMKSVIVAEYWVDESDIMTDYFHVRTERTIIIGFSKHTRNLISEMRRACRESKYEPVSVHGEVPTVDSNGSEKTEENKDWWHPSDENRDSKGIYLKSEKYRGGWVVRKDTWMSEEGIHLLLGKGNYCLPQYEKKEAKLKSRKVVEKYKTEGIKLLKYSERAIAVFGDTKPIKDKLKKLGGRFNGRLTNPETQEKQSGWIFPIKKEKLVVEVLGC